MLQLKWLTIFISVVILLLALMVLDMPYGFYTLLRLVIFASAVTLAYLASRGMQAALVWVLGLIAVIYNPFIPLSLGRNVWEFVNLFTIVLFLIAGFMIRKSPDEGS